MARYLNGTSDPSMTTIGHSERHPSTLNTVNNMGIAFSKHGEYGQALGWYQQALDGYEKTLGKDHPSTLNTVNMGSIFNRQDGALEWYQRALDGRQKKLGEDRPLTRKTASSTRS
jgi:tetratricopeptide (TPR) repeat protein